MKKPKIYSNQNLNYENDEELKNTDTDDIYKIF